MSVGKACTRSVVTVHPEETVQEAAKRLAHHEVGTLVVVEGNKPVGMLTDRDLVIRVMANAARRGATGCRRADACRAEPPRIDSRDGQSR